MLSKQPLICSALSTLDGIQSVTDVTKLLDQIVIEVQR
ncbi:hypothetical protein TNCT_216191, partial [Trichonephila clavata]